MGQVKLRRISSLSSFVVSVAAFVVSFFAAPAPAHAQWHSWPQWQRYGATMNMAMCQNGFDTGMQSKRWMEFVIYSASHTSMQLPETMPNMYEWYPNPFVYKFPAPYPPTMWQPGQIVQMKWNHRPHTAIFVCRYQDPYQNGMYWVDCNWGNGHPGNDRTVEYHFVSFADFFANVGTNYSVYEIH